MLAELFSLDKSPLELVIRATVMWWFIFLVLRFIMKRDMGQVGAADILLLVLVADAAQNGMADEYKSISSGIIVVSTLFFWNWLLNQLASKFEFIEKFLDPPPVMMVKDGKFLKRNMRKEKLSIGDIEAEIRKAGIEDVKDVKFLYFEGSGDFSVIPK